MPTWTIDYKITVALPDAPLESVCLYLAFPQTIALRQTLVSLLYNKKVREVSDDYGNTWLQIKVPATKKFVFRYQAIVETERHEYDLKAFAECRQKPLKKFLQPEPGIECDHPKLIAFAEALQQYNHPIDIIKAAVELVIDKMSYVEQSEECGALFAVTNFEGDCTEYASLLAAILRIRGISARIAVGYLKQELHAITEVYLNGLWIPIDVTHLTSFQFQEHPHYITLMRGNWMLPGGTEKLASFYYRCKSRPTILSQYKITDQRPKVVVLDESLFEHHKLHSIGGICLATQKIELGYQVTVQNLRSLQFTGTLVALLKDNSLNVFPLKIAAHQKIQKDYDMLVDHWIVIDQNEQVICKSP